MRNVYVKEAGLTTIGGWDDVLDIVRDRCGSEVAGLVALGDPVRWAKVGEIVDVLEEAKDNLSYPCESVTGIKTDNVGAEDINALRKAMKVVQEELPNVMDDLSEIIKELGALFAESAYEL